MERPQVLTIRGPGSQFHFRVKVDGEGSAEAMQTIQKLQPIDSFGLHVVVAGETFYIPPPSLALRPANMVERRKGSVYYNVTGQSVCFCYGIVTESTLVNQLGTVADEDLHNLVRLGKLVYDQTCSSRTPSIVKIQLNLGGEAPPSEVSQAKPSQRKVTSSASLGSDWRSSKSKIDIEIDRLRKLEEPEDVKLLRLGATTSRSGSEAAALQPMVILQGFLATLGPHVITRLMTISTYEDMSLSLMVRMTRDFLTKTFNQFEFLADCGLTRMKNVGKLYDNALNSVGSLGEYRELTDSMRSLVQLMFRWVHLAFPWHLKSQLTTYAPSEAASMPSLSMYTEGNKALEFNR